MNYRHAFHAGNFADLLKHATLLALIESLKSDRAPLQLLDTHAGAGIYDLGGEMAAKSGEAAAGIARLMAQGDAPKVFDPLKAAVRALNPDDGGRFYPGSPILAVRALGPKDSYIGCELRPDDQRLLSQALRKHGGGKGAAVLADGYAEAAKPGPAGLQRLVLIDPPFEAAGEYQAIVRACADILQRDRRAVIAIWLPLKDLDTFDRFITALEALDPPSTLIAEARLRALDQPLKMNGCAMVVIGAPAQANGAIETATRWTVDQLGEADGQARLWRIGGA